MVLTPTLVIMRGPAVQGLESMATSGLLDVIFIQCVSISLELQVKYGWNHLRVCGVLHAADKGLVSRSSQSSDVVSRCVLGWTSCWWSLERDVHTGLRREDVSWSSNALAGFIVLITFPGFYHTLFMVVICPLYDFVCRANILLFEGFLGLVWRWVATVC